jgi:hypothetical protein
MWDIEIARDGSSYTVVPDRSANGEYGEYGVHLNALKLLEESPCADCIKLSNVYLLPNGDVSVDVSIIHPFNNAYCTGFDVRGIIMFPASQVWPDNHLRELVELDPWEGLVDSSSHHELGDAELMNPDGYTAAWAPDANWDCVCPIPYGYPIGAYYPGKFASGDNIGTINAFKRYYSSEERHMFEVNKTVTRTFVIRPPASGPIQACYAVYAHWAPPINTPVTNPLVDFGPEANSILPYEFWIEQVQPLDPDAPDSENALRIKWHIKMHQFVFGDHEIFTAGSIASLFGDSSTGGDFVPCPGEPDTYFYEKCPGFTYYVKLNELYPGSLPTVAPFVFCCDRFLW